MPSKDLGSVADRTRRTLTKVVRNYLALYSLIAEPTTNGWYDVIRPTKIGNAVIYVANVHRVDSDYTNISKIEQGLKEQGLL